MKSRKPLKKLARKLSVFGLLFCSACDGGLQTMDAGEYGVVFSALPRWSVLGPYKGGVRPTVIQPGETEWILPWEELISVDTTLRTIGWGGEQEGNEKGVADYVETRSVDGNEVGLAIEIQYRVNPEKVTYVVQKVGVTLDRVKQLVSAVARADIRTHMNVLTTSDFFKQESRQAAVENVKKAMAARLEPEGVDVVRVIFRDYKFERPGEEGQQPDRSYQQQIDDTQATIQQVEQESKKRAALIQQKGQQYEAQEGERKRILAEVRGYARQAKIRGDAYLTKKENLSAQIEAAGMNEVEGMKKRIEALSGPGGEALLRLEIAKALVSSAPRFLLAQLFGIKIFGIR